ncbi:MAG: hypothetical protein ACI90M_004331, partial [Candidatus Azotimanducaceae bacterium]
MAILHLKIAGLDTQRPHEGQSPNRERTAYPAYLHSSQRRSKDSAPPRAIT